jgi:F0F1-type ATP synthase assembly protein I
MDDKLGIIRALALLSQVGISIIVPIIGGLWLGNKLDQLLGTNGVFLVIGILLGVLTGFKTAYELIMAQGDRK